MKTIPVELFGMKLKLSQRSIRDIIDVSLFDSEKDKPEERIFVNAYIVYSALKNNIKSNVPFWNIKALIERYKLKKLITVRSLMERLSFEDLNNLCNKIYELDFGDLSDEKKKKEQEQIYG